MHRYLTIILLCVPVLTGTLRAQDRLLTVDFLQEGEVRNNAEVIEPPTSISPNGQPNRRETVTPRTQLPGQATVPGNDDITSPFSRFIPPPPASLFAQSSPYLGRRTYSRSLRAPNELGHFLPGGTLVTGFDGLTATSILPLAAGIGRLNIADNNKAVPQNRVFFDYRHYHNAVTADASNFIFDNQKRVYNVDSYTFGAEKTFGEEELISLEFRLPFAGAMTFDTFNFGVDGGNMGNASLISKGVLSIDYDHSIVTGLALSFPTGSDASGQVNGFNYTVHNESTYISPYLALLLQPGGSEQLTRGSGATCIDKFLGRSSFQIFGQANIPASSHSVDAAGIDVGGFKEDSLLMLDGSYAFNFCNKPDNRIVTALDGIAELHYARSIGGGNALTFNDGFFTAVSLAGAAPAEMLNFTSGLSAEIRENTRLRVGASVPLMMDKRTFDAEFIVSLNHFF